MLAGSTSCGEAQGALLEPGRGKVVRTSFALDEPAAADQSWSIRLSTGVATSDIASASAVLQHSSTACASPQLVPTTIIDVLATAAGPQPAVLQRLFVILGGFRSVCCSRAGAVRAVTATTTRAGPAWRSAPGGDRSASPASSSDASCPGSEVGRNSGEGQVLGGAGGDGRVGSSPAGHHRAAAPHRSGRADFPHPAPQVHGFAARYTEWTTTGGGSGKTRSSFQKRSQVIRAR